MSSWRALPTGAGTAVACVTAIALAMEPATGAERTAPVVFLSGQALAGASADPATTHEECWDLLASALSSGGAEVIPRADVEPVLRAFRTRTSLGISAALVDSLRSGLGASLLIVADVAIFPGRVVLAGRYVDTNRAEVLDADVIEEVRADPFPTSATESVFDWREAVSAACRRLAGPRAHPAASSDRPLLVFLPVSGVGLGRPLADLTTLCMLRSLIETRAWRVRDPGVAVTTLADAGIDPVRSARGARLALEKECGPCLLLRVDATSWASKEGPMTDDDEERGNVEVREPIPALALSVRLLSAATDTIGFGASYYVEAPRPTGLFGIATDVSQSDHLRTTTDRIAAVLARAGGGG